MASVIDDLDGLEARPAYGTCVSRWSRRYCMQPARAGTLDEALAVERS